MSCANWMCLHVEWDFYRAMLCVSVVFAVAWCLSVRLSRSCILSRRLKIPSNFLFCLVAPSSFLTHALIPNSKGNPFSRGAKYKGWENFEIFNRNLRLSRKWHEIGPWLLCSVNKKSYVLYRMVTFPVTLTDP